MTEKKKHSKTDNKKITTLENRVAPLALGGVMQALESGTAGAGNGSSGMNISNSNLVGGDDNSNSGIIFSPTINVAGASADNNFAGGNQGQINAQLQDARTSSHGGASSSDSSSGAGALAGAGAGASSNLDDSNNFDASFDSHDLNQGDDSAGINNGSGGASS